MWWFMVLTRGKIRLHIMGDQHTWRLNGEGMSAFVEQLPGILREMLGDAAPKPRVIFSERGPGLYNTGTGIIVHAYKNALKKQGFRPWAGDDATWQPPDVPDVLLHETAAGWVRKYFQKHPRTWHAEQEANVRSFREALQQCETCPGCPALGIWPASPWRQDEARRVAERRRDSGRSATHVRRAGEVMCADGPVVGRCGCMLEPAEGQDGASSGTQPSKAAAWQD